MEFSASPGSVAGNLLLTAERMVELTCPGCTLTRCPNLAASSPAARNGSAAKSREYPYFAWLANGNISLEMRRNLIPNSSFHRMSFERSHAFCSPSFWTYASPNFSSLGLVLSGRFRVACSGESGSWRGCWWSRMELMRQVLEQNTGGLDDLRYVFKQAWGRKKRRRKRDSYCQHSLPLEGTSGGGEEFHFLPPLAIVVSWHVQV